MSLAQREGWPTDGRGRAALAARLSSTASGTLGPVVVTDPNWGHAGIEALDDNAHLHLNRRDDSTASQSEGRVVVAELRHW
jgi:hypothetical protein